MSAWSRRDLLRKSAGAAAIAVPMAALSGGVVSAGPRTAAGGAERQATDAELAAFGHEPVMFCVHDAARGEVAVLHGTDEVVVTDPQLVARIMRAAGAPAR